MIKCYIKAYLQNKKNFLAMIYCRGIIGASARQKNIYDKGWIGDGHFEDLSADATT
jgi:hypothetical protein